MRDLLRRILVTIDESDGQAIRTLSYEGRTFFRQSLGSSMTNSVSMRAVASRAGVSVGTVSNTVNRPGSVSATTLRRVQAAIEELGFVRNEAARQLRLGKSRAVGFVMLDGENPVLRKIVRVAQDRLADAGFVMMLGDSARDLRRESGYLDLFEELRVRGILISPLGNVDGRLHQLDSRGIGAVLVDGRSPDGKVSSVSVDEVAGGRLATRHLVQRGCRRIAFVGSEATVKGADRLAGVRQEIAMSPDLSFEIVSIPAPNALEGRRVGGEIARRARSRWPDGIFADNDVVATGLMQGLTGRSQSIRIPSEIAIIGYDDTGFAESAEVPITSVRYPAVALGATAVALLLAEASDPDRPKQQVSYRPEVVERASTGVRLAAGESGSGPPRWSAARPDVGAGKSAGECL